MTGLALALILAAAFIHATWNFLLKRSGGGTAFVWLFGAPFRAALCAARRRRSSGGSSRSSAGSTTGFMAASAALHTAYYMLLDRGYRSGDFSLVYPLARGTGPLITMLCAVLLLHEQPGALAVGGALLIGCGAFLLTGDPRKLRRVGQLPRDRLRASHGLHDRLVHAGGQARGGGVADPAAGAGLGDEPRARRADDASRVEGARGAGAHLAPRVEGDRRRSRSSAPSPTSWC